MAKIVDNEKGFKVIEMSRSEVSMHTGGYGICDYCSSQPLTGYYIAVLNSWYCLECYASFNLRATRYLSDVKFEERNFNDYKNLLKI